MDPKGKDKNHRYHKYRAFHIENSMGKVHALSEILMRQPYVDFTMVLVISQFEIA